MKNKNEAVEFREQREELKYSQENFRVVVKEMISLKTENEDLKNTLLDFCNQSKMTEVNGQIYAKARSLTSKSPTQCKSDDGKCELKDSIIAEAREIEANHPSKDARAFARTVLSLASGKCWCGNGLEPLDKMFVTVAVNEVLKRKVASKEISINLDNNNGCTSLDIANIICSKFGTPKPSHRSDMPIMPTELELIDCMNNVTAIEPKGPKLTLEYAQAILQLLKSKGW